LTQEAQTSYQKRLLQRKLQNILQPGEGVLWQADGSGRPDLTWLTALLETVAVVAWFMTISFFVIGIESAWLFPYIKYLLVILPIRLYSVTSPLYVVTDRRVLILKDVFPTKVTSFSAAQVKHHRLDINRKGVDIVFNVGVNDKGAKKSIGFLGLNDSKPAEAALRTMLDLWTSPGDAGRSERTGSGESSVGFAKSTTSEEPLENINYKITSIDLLNTGEICDATGHPLVLLTIHNSGHFMILVKLGSLMCIGYLIVIYSLGVPIPMPAPLHWCLSLATGMVLILQIMGRLHVSLNLYRPSERQPLLKIVQARGSMKRRWLLRSERNLGEIRMGILGIGGSTAYYLDGRLVYKLEKPVLKRYSLVDEDGKMLGFMEKNDREVQITMYPNFELEDKRSLWAIGALLQTGLNVGG